MPQLLQSEGRCLPRPLVCWQSGDAEPLRLNLRVYSTAGPLGGFAALRGNNFQSRCRFERLQDGLTQSRKEGLGPSVLPQGLSVPGTSLAPGAALYGDFGWKADVATAS